MGYVYGSKSRVVVNACGKHRVYMKSAGNRGRFLLNLAMFLADKLDLKVNYDRVNQPVILINEDVEKAFSEIIDLSTTQRSGKAIVMWLLSVWDILKEHGLDKHITLEDMLRLY